MSKDNTIRLEAENGGASAQYTPSGACTTTVIAFLRITRRL